jgi:hypothetical protein
VQHLDDAAGKGVNELGCDLADHGGVKFRLSRWLRRHVGSQLFAGRGSATATVRPFGELIGAGVGLGAARARVLRRSSLISSLYGTLT